MCDKIITVSTSNLSRKCHFFRCIIGRSVTTVGRQAQAVRGDRSSIARVVGEFPIHLRKIMGVHTQDFSQCRMIYTVDENDLFNWRFVSAIRNQSPEVRYSLVLSKP